jgi:hypothetical protein
VEWSRWAEGICARLLRVQKLGAAIGMGMVNAGGAAEPKWEVERTAVNNIVSYATDSAHADEGNAQRVGFVFERTGFANWRLAEVCLPNR